MTDILAFIKQHKGPGLYVIVNTVDGKRYVGQGEDVGVRAANQWNRLRRGDHEIPRLQADWNRLGEDAFTIQFHAVPASALDGAEAQLIDEMQALEHLVGYNKMMSAKKWGPEARIRNSEKKLLHSCSFCRLPEISTDAPMIRSYVESFGL